jgi:hypothetical protein
MGNIIGIDENFGNIPKTNYNSKIPLTATGRFSSPGLTRNSMKELSRGVPDKKNINTNSKKECNSLVIKDIFPPPKSDRYRNTISPSTFKKELKLEADYNLQARESTENSENENIHRARTETMPNITYIKDKNKYFFPISAEDYVSEGNIEQAFSNISKQANDYELNYIKTGEDIRRSYIAKLIYKKVWQPTIKEKSHNSLIIFDWDDTLLCTSFLTPNGVFTDDIKIPEKDFEKIRNLEASASSILKLAISKGDTYIITNAAPGWVEYSAKKFYPEVYKLLNKVTIVSARGEYEKKFPGDSRQWKIHAFLEMQKNLDTNLVTNLLCLGDSIIEMEAAHILVSKFSHAYIKTIKFRECPKPEELHKQLNLVIDQFSVIFSAIKNLTIRVEKKTKENSKEKDR